MSYRNKTYVAFDADNDIRYYYLMKVMKSIIHKQWLLISLALIVSVQFGCAPMSTISREHYKSYNIGEEVKTNSGSSMVTFRNIEYVHRKVREGIKTTLGDTGYKHELIYTGRSGSTIHILFREYINDLARVAFHQNLRYDLDISNTLKFKEYKIEVLEANNEHIRFRVLADDTIDESLRKALYERQMLKHSVDDIADDVLEQLEKKQVNNRVVILGITVFGILLWVFL